ncbi:MAG TPA: DUF4157 domain-containing protein, partial [Myxococcales bacterium]|nr:DUF4157 domain-containing protein [Myxococcales bacterium]
SYVSREVQNFEATHAKTQKKIADLLAKGQGNAASIELMGLGSECDSIDKAVQEAKTLSKGHPQYEKEAKFYEDWHKQTKAKLAKAIADTKGLGGQVAISGFGLSEQTHPDIFENTKNIYAVRTKVEAFGAALHDHDAATQVKAVLAEAQAAKSHLAALKAKYKKDPAAQKFFAGGIQDKLIDEPLKKLQEAVSGKAPADAKKHDLTKKDPSSKKPDEKKPHELKKTVEHGLKAIDKYKKKAARAGKKVDHGIVKVEHALKKGIDAGKKVDHGLQKASGIAEQVSKFFGHDSPIGHLADHVSTAAGGAHDKLHQALGMAQKGKSALDKGHKLVKGALDKAKDHHAAKLEKVHGKKPANAEHEHGGVPHQELVKHATGKKDAHARDAHKEASPHDAHKGPAKHGKPEAHKGQKGPGKHGKPSPHDHQATPGKAPQGAGGDAHPMLAVGSTGPAVSDLQTRLNGLKLNAGKVDGIFGPITRGAVLAFQKARALDVDGIVGPHTWAALLEGNKPSPHDGPPRNKGGKTPASMKTPSPHGKPGDKHPAATEAVAGAAVQAALAAVTAFGKAVGAAVKEIGELMQAKKTKEAGDKVQALSQLSEHCRSEVTKAVKASAKFATLAKQAQAASKHYLDIRAHFFDFVKTLHGLAGDEKKHGDANAKSYPDLLELMSDIKSLEVKVGTLGHSKNADSAMKTHVGELQKEAKALRARVSKAQAMHAKDEKAKPLIQDIDARLDALEKQLAAQAGKAAQKKGDKDLGQGKHKPPATEHAGAKKQEDPVDHILKHHLGDDNRIHVDKGGARGDMDVQDRQDVDPAAMDTWIGSGEGVKLFSEVFGAFIPAEGQLVVTQPQQGGGGKSRGGAHAGPGLPHVPAGGPGGNTGIGGGLHLPDIPGLPGGLQLPHLPGGMQLPHIGLPGQIHMPKLPGLGGGQGGGIGGFLGGIFNNLKQHATGFFKGLFDHLHGFADKIAGWSKMGSSLLGKGMHYAEMGMHGLNVVEGYAQKAQGFAGKAEGFLDKIGLHKAAGFAGKVGNAAGFVNKEAGVLHGDLKTADKLMGKGKSIAGEVEHGAEKASGVFDQAAHGRFGQLVNLFRAAKDGSGYDGKLVPEKMSLSSHFDEPQRLDMTTLSKMEMFLGGTFSGVRIHTGPGAAQVTQRFNAEAVTVKDHIFFAPGRFSPSSVAGQRLLAHELTHVMQKGRKNLDVRTAETEALRAEHTYGSPDMTTLNLSQPRADFKLADGMGMGNPSGVYTAKRNRNKGYVSGAKDTLPDGEELIEKVSDRVYDMLMEELEQSFESR